MLFDEKIHPENPARGELAADSVSVLIKSASIGFVPISNRLLQAQEMNKKGETAMNNEELRFYPRHPSDSKTHQIETTAMPVLPQDAPFDVKTLCSEFAADAEGFFAKYTDRRFDVTGIAKKVGPDIHHKPSIELSDRVDGQTYALTIFPTDAHYSKVNVGDRVTVRANYLVMSNHYGTVMKFSELICAGK